MTNGDKIRSMTDEELEAFFMCELSDDAAGKPMILTSNLSPQEFLHPAELSRSRVFSRVAEVCTIVSVTGADRRMERRKMEQREDRNRLTAAANE